MSSSLPPRPAHLPAPPAFVAPTASRDDRRASLSGGAVHSRDAHAPSDYDGERRDGRDRADDSRERERRRDREPLPRDERYDDIRDGRDSRSQDDRKRRRSASPNAQQGRHEPRLRMDDTDRLEQDRERIERRPKPPSFSSGSSGPPRPIFSCPDPATMPYLLSFHEWSNWKTTQRPSPDAVKDDRTLHQKYDAYKKEFTSRQLYGLFMTQKSSRWFEEKYSNEPNFVDLRKYVKSEARGTAFVDALRAGALLRDDGRLKAEWRHEDEETSEDDMKTDLIDGSEKADSAATKPSTLVSVPPRYNQLFIKAIPPTASREALEAACRKSDAFVNISFSKPSERKNYIRSAWINLRDDCDAAEENEKINGSIILSPAFTLRVSVNEEGCSGEPRWTPIGACSVKRLRIDLDQAARLAKLLESEVGVEGVPPSEDIDELCASVEDSSDDIEEKRASLKFKLDLWLSYLRDAFHTCYYSYLLADSREELHQHSIQYFRRRPADAAPSPPLRFRSSSAADGGEKGTDEPEKEDVKMKEVEPALKSNKWKVVSEVVEEEKKPEVAEEDPILEDASCVRWAMDLDRNLRAILDRSTLDASDYGGKNYASELDKATAPHYKQESEGKFRCQLCNKLFKGAEFLRKHIPAKHPEVVQDKLSLVHYFNNFALDPHHLALAPNSPAFVDASSSAFGVPWTNPAFAQVASMFMDPALASRAAATGYTPGFVGFQNSAGVFNPLFQQSSGRTGVASLAQEPVGGRAGGGGDRRNGGGGGGSGSGMGRGSTAGRGDGPSLRDRIEQDERPPLPPVKIDTSIGRPAGVKEDPRAARGVLSYTDIDNPPSTVDGGEPMLQY